MLVGSALVMSNGKVRSVRHIARLGEDPRSTSGDDYETHCTYDKTTTTNPIHSTAPQISSDPSRCYGFPNNSFYLRRISMNMQVATSVENYLNPSFAPFPSSFGYNNCHNGRRMFMVDNMRTLACHDEAWGYPPSSSSDSNNMQYETPWKHAHSKRHRDSSQREQQQQLPECPHKRPRLDPTATVRVLDERVNPTYQPLPQESSTAIVPYRKRSRDEHADNDDADAKEHEHKPHCRCRLTDEFVLRSQHAPMIPAPIVGLSPCTAMVVWAPPPNTVSSHPAQDDSDLEDESFMDTSA